MCGICEIVVVIVSDIVASNLSLYSTELFTHLRMNLPLMVRPLNVSRDTFVL